MPGCQFVDLLTDGRIVGEARGAADASSRAASGNPMRIARSRS